MWLTLGGLRPHYRVVYEEDRQSLLYKYNQPLYNVWQTQKVILQND